MRPTGAAVSVVKATLKQKPVVRLVNENLTRGLAIVERFGNGWIRSGEDDETVIVASVAGTAAVVIAVRGIEGMAADESVPAFVVFRVAHGEEMSGINREEQLEVDFAS